MNGLDNSGGDLLERLEDLGRAERERARQAGHQAAALDLHDLLLGARIDAADGLFDLLRRALTSAAERGYSFTDDCAAVESLGTIVKATHGSYQNIKITTPEDILVAEELLTREDK